MDTTNNSKLPITPEKFWVALSSSLNKNWTSKKVDEFWFKVIRDRTNFMFETIENLDHEFNCFAEREYQPRIDITFFDRKQVPSWGPWAKEVAIEIENYDSWRDEVCKLMEINAGLKVLVAYVEGPEDLALNSFWKELPEFYRSRKYLTQPCNWLFVFGIFDGPKGDWDFKAYKFDGEKHTDITGITGRDRTRPSAPLFT